MKKTVAVQTNITRSARVAQIEGLFDVPPIERAALTWEVDIPIEDREWFVGAIVGPSGCGKSTVARAMFGDSMSRVDELRSKWLHGRSLLDSFPHSMGVREVVDLLSSVGFSSPPSWVRPFEVLSNGEQFRVMMARVLAETARDQIAVVDEFTSVVDRTVARVGSSAIARTVRKRGQKFVAVTCHEDVIEWLQPEWVYYPAEQRFAWRSVQPRPSVPLSIFRVDRDAWRLFKHHHYLSQDISKSATCFVAVANFVDMGPRVVAFDSWITHFGAVTNARCGRRSHRVVTLPDYQGLGIGPRVNNFLASMWRGLGDKPFLSTSHPGFVAQRRRDPNWKITREPSRRHIGDKGEKGARERLSKTRSADRLMASFEYVGPAMSRDQANRVMNTWIKI